MARKKNAPSGDVVKKQIVEAAVKNVLLKGFAGTSIADISNALGLSKAALYWHFKNKDELFGELLKYVKIQYIEELRGVSCNEALDPVEKMTGIFTLSFQKTFDELNTCMLPMKLLVEVLGTNSQFESMLRDTYRELIQIISSVLDEGKERGVFAKNFDSWTFAMCIVGSMDGVLHQCMLHNYGNTLEECEEKLFFSNILKSILVN